MTFELPAEAQHWTAAERDLAQQVWRGKTVVVNVRRNGPHRRLLPWLVDQGLLSYIGHAGPRHNWPASAFANPFVRQAHRDRAGAVRRYSNWLDHQPELLNRIQGGELTGRALGCWCAPDACHGDVLAARTDRAARTGPQAREISGHSEGGGSGVRRPGTPTSATPGELT